MKKALFLYGLIGTLGIGCSKDTTKTDNAKTDNVVTTPTNYDTIDSNNVVVEFKEYKDGYKKNIKNSPYGNLYGEYRSAATGTSLDSKVRINVMNNIVIGYVDDQEDDGKADSIQLEGHLNPVRNYRDDHPHEFDLADKILKYWKETK